MRARVPAGFVFAAVLAAGAVVRGCLGSGGAGPATTPSASAAPITTPTATPTTVAAASPTPSPSASPTSSPTPAPSPTPTDTPVPPEPGAVWGALQFSPATTTAPQGAVMDRIVFRHQAYGIARKADVSGGTRFSIMRQVPDGSWSEVLAAPDAYYQVLLVASESTIVAVAGNRFWVSGGGSNWTSGTLPSSSGRLVTYITLGASGFIAGDSSGTMWKSKDGTSWRKFSRPAAFGAAQIDSVTGVPGGYVAGGGINRVVQVPGYMGTLGGSVAAWWSVDGERWTQSAIEVPKGGAQVLGCIYPVGSNLFARGWLYTDGDNGMGYISAAWTSADRGKSWKYHAIDTRNPDLRPTFFPEIPVSRSTALATDGRRLISIMIGDNVPSTGIYETLDGSNWHQLQVDGLPNLNATLGTVGIDQIVVDDAGVTIDFGGNQQVRGLATT